ncbi:MAG: YitT family protein [Clostridiales bacterium]|jgi:uncharacterized membrane-anchored protein YitT (DUF2179 family)|nr:YitT family protein [Clostridiales bacterium]
MPKNKTVRTVLRFAIITVGAALAALALEVLLVPNGVIDGGVVGIAIMCSAVFGLPTGLFTILLNIPFLYFGYSHGGRKFIIRCVYAIVMFSMFMSFFEDMSPFTNDIFLSVVFGGLILGVGVGIILRLGGSLDGTEMLAIALSKSTAFSVGQFVMFCNVFILGVSGFIFGWDKAMYSIITYFVVFKLIDIIVEGLDESKAAMIITDNPEEMAAQIMEELGRSITFIFGEKGYTKNESKIIYAVVTRMEVSKLREIVTTVDRKSFVTITNISDVVGGSKKK